MMSEHESNVCATCGGMKRIDWTISFEECHPVEVRFDPASLANNWRLCPGHPEPTLPYLGNETLAPKQVIAMLDFFKLRCPELEQIAKEQEEPATKHDGNLAELLRMAKEQERG